MDYEAGEENMATTKCKYFCKRLITCRALMTAITDITSTGGCGHLVVGDGNMDIDSLQRTIDWCAGEDASKPEAPIVKLLCEELSKLPIQSRRLLWNRRYWLNYLDECFANRDCDSCTAIADESEL